MITLDVFEADTAYREKIPEQMGKPYRTLLGHLRHESGHYYWERLISLSGPARQKIEFVYQVVQEKQGVAEAPTRSQQMLPPACGSSP